LTALALFFLPTSGREALERGVPPIAFSLPSVWAHLTAEDGGAATLARSFETVTAMEWINTNSEKRDGVILYEDTRGYYLNRPYLWGNRAHSGYIPYDTMQSGADLTRWLKEQGVRFALVNLNWSEKRGDTLLPPQAPIGLEREALQRWYVELPEAAEAWRKLISDAIRRGLWRVVYTGRGVVVLEVETVGVQNP
jgi:hypothetical protein